MTTWGPIESEPEGPVGPGSVLAVVLVGCGLSAVQFYRQADGIQMLGALLFAVVCIGVWIALAIAARREKR